MGLFLKIKKKGKERKEKERKEGEKKELVENK